MNFSSSLLEALIGGVFEFLFLLPPGIKKGMAKTAPSVAMDSYIPSVSAGMGQHGSIGIQGFGALLTYDM
jgi:hypothetical protein